MPGPLFPCDCNSLTRSEWLQRQRRARTMNYCAKSNGGPGGWRRAAATPGGRRQACSGVHEVHSRGLPSACVFRPPTRVVCSVRGRAELERVWVATHSTSLRLLPLAAIFTRYSPLRHPRYTSLLSPRLLAIPQHTARTANMRRSLLLVMLGLVVAVSASYDGGYDYDRPPRPHAPPPRRCRREWGCSSVCSLQCSTAGSSRIIMPCSLPRRRHCARPPPACLPLFRCCCAAVCGRGWDRDYRVVNGVYQDTARGQFVEEGEWGRALCMLRTQDETFGGAVPRRRSRPPSLPP